ncbi:FadR/GntR family transcriptional regulator [Tessaracoccus antarcticus]|uniref:FadR family transcriptional regulator n=1 Tax=Tessaracoccus antarcticus TaxID=2479848 RepID=A0A3M0GCX3_9ACTN|nr:FCD domain-containing protein [Tessaracoccus antarcticus]RMB62377.1 FadR family transcriptional regulator [Tessaracoccus antarcticus]
MSAVETARTGLARMIASGELGAGQLLPSEADLCERFGVSRSSLREAQKMLSVAGVLTSRPGRRSAVSEMKAPQIMSGLEMVMPLLPLDRYLELFSLREVLEGHVAAQAAARMTDAECGRLVELAEELATTPPSDLAQTLDAEFHSMIIRGAGDEMVASLLEVMRRRGRDYRMFEMSEGDTLKGISDHAHGEIALAIRNRDPESARYLSMQHVRVTRAWLESLRPGPIVFEPDPGGSSARA